MKNIKTKISDFLFEMTYDEVESPDRSLIIGFDNDEDSYKVTQEELDTLYKAEDDYGSLEKAMEDNEGIKILVNKIKKYCKIHAMA
jgi:hypothetical protein